MSKNNLNCPEFHMCLGSYYAIFRGFLFLQPERIHRSLRTDPTDTNDWSVWHGQVAHSQQILKPTVGGHWTGPLWRDPMSPSSSERTHSSLSSQSLREGTPSQSAGCINERICYYSKDYFLIPGSKPRTVYYLNSNTAQVFFKKIKVFKRKTKTKINNSIWLSIAAEGTADTQCHLPAFSPEGTV